jgi:gas vesicle protein
MSIVFYFGDREVDSFRLSLHRGKATLCCTITERWEERFARVLKCGNSRKAVLSRKCGITLEERENLEATVKGSIGLKGIAELKSEMAGKTETKIEFNESTETKEEFTFSAPRCGRLDLTSYQLRRIYHLEYDDRRVWHRDTWTRNFGEWIDRIYDDSQRYPYDPDCQCQPAKKEPKVDGKLSLIFSDKLAMNTGFYRTSGHLHFPELEISLSQENLDHIAQGHSLKIRSDLLPAYLLFLAGIASRSVTMHLADPETVQSVWRVHKRKAPKTKLSASAALAYLASGGLVGVALAFLFASEGSDETREYLAAKADEGRNYAYRKARELRERADKLIERSKLKQEKVSGVSVAESENAQSRNRAI